MVLSKPCVSHVYHKMFGEFLKSCSFVFFLGDRVSILESRFFARQSLPFKAAGNDSQHFSTLQHYNNGIKGHLLNKLWSASNSMTSC